MSDQRSNTATGGIGFGGALTILFIALKLTHVIDWSWLWVLSPLWIPMVAFLGLFLLIVGVYLFGFILGLVIKSYNVKKSRSMQSRKLQETLNIYKNKLE